MDNYGYYLQVLLSNNQHCYSYPYLYQGGKCLSPPSIVLLGARLGHLCDPGRIKSICKDKGLSYIYTIVVQEVYNRDRFPDVDDVEELLKCLFAFQHCNIIKKMLSRLFWISKGKEVTRYNCPRLIIICITTHKYRVQ